MTVISNDPRIIDLSGDVYLVLDKFVHFKPGVFDLADPDDCQALVEIARGMFTDVCDPRVYGKDTVGWFTSDGNGGYRQYCCHVSEFPKPIQDAVEEVRHVKLDRLSNGL